MKKKKKGLFQANANCLSNRGGCLKDDLFVKVNINKLAWNGVGIVIIIIIINK